MLSIATLALALSASLVSGAPAPPAPGAPAVQLKNGSYTGVRSEQYKQDFFLGIPYAQPPVGDLRYRNPVPLKQTWKDPKPATQYSPSCFGYGSDQIGYAQSEDCLYLNVIRPAGYEKQNLPVAFWIHGGGFFMGGGGDRRYNASFIVENSVKIGKPIMVVNFNYRLSAWGFLSGSEEFKNGPLNLGLRDQRLALHWVQENIKAFGGDPKQVTIFGESAGGASVGFHLTAYGGRDDKLFRGAIMQSGNPINFGVLPDYKGYSAQYNELIRRTNCASSSSPLGCLRALPTDQLNSAINATSTTLNITSWMPVVDGDFLKERTSRQLQNGQFVKVPIIDGANSDEGSAFSPQPVNSTADFKAFVETSAPPNKLPADLVEKLLKAYPDDPKVNVIDNMGDARPGFPPGVQFRRSASYFGDLMFIAPRRKTCETWAANGLPAYCYRFNAIPAGLPPVVGVTHFQEVAFVFLNLEGVGYAPIAVPPFQGKPESYRSLSRFMSSNWASFVHDLDPNAWRKSSGYTGQEAMWAKYDNANPQDIVFDANVTSHMEPDTFRKEGMKLINDNALSSFGR